jgi:hypothetical protein
MHRDMEGADLHWLDRQSFAHPAQRLAEPRPGRRLPAGHRVIGYGFFTDGAMPGAAIAHIGPRWPALRFVLRPRPPD